MGRALTNCPLRHERAQNRYVGRPVAPVAMISRAARPQRMLAACPMHSHDCKTTAWLQELRPFMGKVEISCSLGIMHDILSSHHTIYGQK